MDEGDESMDKDFQFIQELVDALCGLQVHLVPNTRQGVETAIQRIFPEMLPSVQTESKLMRSLQSLSWDCIYELNGPVDLQFSFFCCASTGQMLVLGPGRRGKLNREQMLAQLQSLHMEAEKAYSFVEYCLQQPVIPYEKLHSLTALFARRMLQSDGPIPFQTLDYRWNAEERLRMLHSTSFQELDDVRRIEGRYEASAALTEAVKQGNLSLAYHFIGKMNSVPDDLARNPNPLRNAQNLCIILNTQLRHAMEEMGIPPFRLDQVSGSIAGQIEKFTTVSAISSYYGEILRLYCSLAQEKEQKELSPFARLAVTYIRSHLSDNLTVKDAAKALLVNPDYLSDRFHKEVGEPFITYLNRARIQQAAALLRRTDLQIQQIASAVGYNNTSYFARQFMRFQGMTPRAYRKM